ncbi:SpoIID/LytB domain-containing protein [uncultured Robinsoniella sp.]|uniref:SpoIID/LytB domain-containing protein n=1 Tax=uncultured Robinsoniella sp. TaxID=904190 RepID=UPI00374E2B99
MKDDNTFGKILILSGCIMAFLLLCFYDTYRKKGDDVLNKLQETIQTDLAKQKETTEDKSSKTDKKISDGKNKESDQKAAQEQKEEQKEVQEDKSQEAKTQKDKTQEDKNNSEKASSGDAQTTSAENPLIRVLIKTDNYESEYHSSVTLQCSTDYVLQYGENSEEHKASEELTLTADSPYLNNGILRIQPKDENGEISLPGLKRGYENPSYLGNFEVVKRDAGLLVINELPLETYLCSVVPSEMPAAYPLESLKVQAVCARSYAIKQMQNGRGAEFNVHVDDSVSYQVYNNQKRDERASKAVNETAGQVMRSDGEIVDALYYSTSCGVNLSQDLSQETVFASFMTTDNHTAYEAGEPWYRWKAVFTIDELTRLANAWQPGTGNVTSLNIDSRETNGAIAKFTVQGENQNISVEGEYNVRKLLSPVNIAVVEQDGSEAAGMSLLPSAFFYLTPNYENDVLVSYTLIGGGYGHGKGMSQNGARHMADAGMGYEEILKYFYGDVQIG